MKKIVNKIRNEQGQALPIVLILMVIGGLIIAPLLSYVSSGLLTGQVYEAIADELYAADAGVEDGLWQIRNDNLNDLFGGYDPYDYDTVYDYPASYPVWVNGLDVEVTIENVWVPDINEPDAAEANQLIGAGKLIITGNVVDDPVEGEKQQVKIYYYKGETDGPLQVNTIGIWIPPGFYYDETSECELETWLEADPDTDYSREIYPHCGGEAVVWTLSNVYFPDLPNVDTMNRPWASTFEFKYTTTLVNRYPEAIAWITTSGVSNIPYAWDADVKVYHINSEAGGEGGTTVEAYAIKSELRELGSAISGDYVAIGNSLMARSRSTIRYRDILLNESNATANTIPANARVEAAFLYWSGWVEEVPEDEIFFDDCSDIKNGNWYYGSDWRQYQAGPTRAFYAEHVSGGGKELEMVNLMDLSGYEDGTVVASWQNWTRQDRQEPDDCIQYAFGDADGWGDWDNAFCGNFGTSPRNYSVIIPDEYVTSSFRIKFRIEGFSGSQERCYIDNIRVTAQPATIADTSAIFKINGKQVYFEDDAYGNPTVPTEGNEKIIAQRWQVINNMDYGQPHGYSYSSYRDVTGLVRKFTANGNATYTVGDVNATWDARDEWAYAGWSLVIVYASPATKGHQLYLYDTFLYCNHNTNLDFDQDLEPGGTISGFLVPDQVAGEEIAATITCFVGEGDDWYEGDYFQFNGSTLDDGTSSLYDVWNGRSVGMSAEGVDVDTFYVTWASDLLEPGDTSAQVDIYTEIDIWNLVYIILSFRSETVTGGAITYLIRG